MKKTALVPFVILAALLALAAFSGRFGFGHWHIGAVFNAGLLAILLINQHIRKRC